jgi:hypothetical protein
VRASVFLNFAAALSVEKEPVTQVFGVNELGLGFKLTVLERRGGDPIGVRVYVTLKLLLPLLEKMSEGTIEVRRPLFGGDFFCLCLRNERLLFKFSDNLSHPRFTILFSLEPERFRFKVFLSLLISEADHLLANAIDPFLVFHFGFLQRCQVSTGMELPEGLNCLLLPKSSLFDIRLSSHRQCPLTLVIEESIFLL